MSVSSRLKMMIGVGAVALTSAMMYTASAQDAPPTPEQLAAAERLAGDLTLVEPAAEGTPESQRKVWLSEVERTALAHARACATQRPRHIIDAHRQAHLRAIDTYQRLYGRKPERIAGVWM